MENMKEPAFNFETKSKFIEYFLSASYYPENFNIKQFISSSPQLCEAGAIIMPILQTKKQTQKW